MDDITSFKMKTCFSAEATEWAVFSSPNHIPPGQATCVLYLGHVTSSLNKSMRIFFLYEQNTETVLHPKEVLNLSKTTLKVFPPHYK